MLLLAVIHILMQNLNQFGRKVSIIVQWIEHWYFFRGQDKTADFGKETKPPISKMRQKPPILKWDKTADFVKKSNLSSKLFLWEKRFGIIIDN